MNAALRRTLHPEQLVVDIEQAGAAAIDERWSFGRHKGTPRWLWHAIDHHTGAVLAYVLAAYGRGVAAAHSVAGALWAHALLDRSCAP